MSQVIEIRDLDEARKFLLQGLWLQRVMHPSASTVKPTLEWSLEIAAGGQPLPPTGFVADIGFVALGMDRETKAQRDAITVPGFPSGLIRTYEDHVLGKLYSDWTFERASDALRRYQGPDQKRDRSRGLAYILKQIRERGQLLGVELSPALIRTLLEGSAEDHLVRGWEWLNKDGPMPSLLQMYQALIDAARRMAEVLALEDVIALEQRTALADLGQYVAHRQVLQIAHRLEEGLPKQKVRPLPGRQEVPTRVLDEDAYPVGGFSSISNRGSIESLLHSQLAYMEPDPQSRPDLFDIKFLRDELYYYARDENQFLRQHKSFVIVLLPDLVQARFKDLELPCQRIVLTMALLLATVRKLADWLSTDALRFEFLFLVEEQTTPLDHEKHLLEMLLREWIENEIVVIREFAKTSDLSKYCDQIARRSLCQGLMIGVDPPVWQSDSALLSQLRIQGPTPTLTVEDRPIPIDSPEDAFDHWTKTLEVLLQLWI